MQIMTDTQAENQAPPIDRFVIYDDGSASAHSKNGTFYDMQFFGVGGSYNVPHCGCKWSATRKLCRHRRKLKARLLAPERIEKFFGPCEILEDADIPVDMETECDRCKEFVVDCFVRVKPKGYYYGGQLHLAVCGCGVKYGAAFLAEAEAS